MKCPFIDLSQCTQCMGCVEAYPEIFRLNDAGFVELIEDADVSEIEVEEAMKYCPEDCILWE